MVRLLLLVIALILYASLYPWHFNFSRAAGDPLLILLHSWSWEWDRYVVRGVVANVLFYVPLGAVAFLAFARRGSRILGFFAAILLGMALSAAVEILQLYVPGRDCGLLDVVTNTAGAALGASVALLYRRELEHTWTRRAAAAVSPPFFLLACWLGYQLYPFIPVLHPTLLLTTLTNLHPTRAFSSLEVWANAAGWLAAAVVIDFATRGRRSTRWLILAMLSLPLRILMAGRTLPFEAILGAVLALLLWTLFPAPWRRPAALCALASAILLSELAPFHFTSPPSAFSWIPFAASMEAGRQAAIIVLLRKAFDYGAVVWLLHLSGLSYTAAAALSASALALCEAFQRYLPGRTPESTDPVIAISMALILWCFGGGCATYEVEARPRGVPLRPIPTAKRN